MSTNSDIKSLSILNIPTFNVNNILGLLTNKQVNDYDDYSNLYKLRHDLIHRLICEYRSIPFGENPMWKTLEAFGIEINNSEWDLVKNQSPDIVIVTKNHIQITEITISRSDAAERNKISKYSLLFHILKKEGFQVDVEIIVLLPNPKQNNPFDLSKEHKFSSSMVDQIMTTLEFFHSLFAELHTTRYGQSWYIQFHELLGEKEVLNFDVKSAEQIYTQLKNKTFHCDEDFIKCLVEKTSCESLTPDDNSFIDNIVEESLKIDLKLTKSEKELIDVRNKINSQSNTTRLRSFFPLPYIPPSIKDSAERHIIDDETSVICLLGDMQRCNDDILSSIGYQMSGTMSEIKLTKDQKYRIALEGPGRKKFIRSASKEHLEAELENRLYSLSFDVNLDYITSLSYQFSFKGALPEPTTNLDEDLNHILNIKSKGLDYVKACQSIYREVNINSLRKERKKNFILRPTGVKGIFVLIHPGAKLRTGDKKSVIWFKIIMKSEEFDWNHDLMHNICFKKIHNDGLIWHSSWVSTDVNRLDHYIRCFDKVLMAYSAYLHSSSEMTLLEAFRSDSSNTLGLIIMIYMEDKRSTSAMIQDARYVVMSELSIYKYTNKILDKMMTAMRTPLQLYLFKQVMEFVTKIRMMKLSDIIDFGDVVFDSDTQTFQDANSGAKITLPRIFTSGGQVTFKQVLCEMYFTMLFNKNQDDQTHSSFQILSKMLEGEASLQEVKATGLHLGYSPIMSDHEVAKYLLNNPHANQFSRKAIEIGSILQSKDRNCVAKGGLAHLNAQLKGNLDKPIDEFATYKSSAIDGPTKYDPFNAPNNPRRRCLEGCLDLHDKGLYTSFKVAERISEYPTVFHIFKKNQIGGVREILILTIEKRIAINVLETFSRNICKQDDREMLTHGNNKFEKIRDMHRSLKMVNGKRLMIHLNFDKSRWGPSFMPIQFLYLYTRFKSIMPTYFNYFAAILSQHHNKKCVLPAPLIKAWSLDPSNHYQHRMDKNLQNLKEKFLRDFEMSFINESNMGQGILHYTSSLLHLCLLSFRDELFKRMLNKLKLKIPEWIDVVSSDDSLTSISIEIQKGNLSPLTLNLFLRATEASERLFNCWTSTSKSSISLLINEFNSVFGSNLTSFPTLFKFALASVQPLSTDSFYRMVKESYSSSRQLFENGGSLELYLLSQKLNKIYCEQIYHTDPGSQNDLTNFGIRYGNAPYHVGFFPLGDPALMLMFGPEFHNYNLFLNQTKLNDVEVRLFKNSHKIIKDDMVQSMASLVNTETTLGGVLRIEANIGPSNRLLRIRKTLKWDRDVIQSKISDDPMLLFRRKKDPDEIYLRICLKLFQSSASEALRTTCASIYYGRVAASVSANAFFIPNKPIDSADENSLSLCTYKECMTKMLNEPGFEDMNHFRLIYPHLPDYENLSRLSVPKLIYTSRSPFNTMNVRKLLCINNESRMFNPIYSILDKFWAITVSTPTLDNKFKRDWVTVKRACPVIKDTLSETLDQFTGDRNHKLSGLLLILMRLHSLNEKKLKAFVYGPSSYNPKDTYYNLTTGNYRQNITTAAGVSLDYVNPTITNLDTIYLLHNYHILRTFVDDKWNQVDMSRVFRQCGISDEEFDHVINSPNLTPQIRKRLIFTVFSTLPRPLPQWTSLTGIVAHKWLLRQRYNKGSWSGKYSILLQLGKTKVRFDGDNYGVNIYNDHNDDLTSLAIVIKRGLELLDFKEDRLPNLAGKGEWVLVADKCLPTISDSGFHMTHETINDIDFGLCYVTVDKENVILKNSDHEKIYQVTTGLLRTNSTTDVKSHDFQVFGLWFSDLVELGAFKEVWDVTQFNRKDLLKYTRQLNIDPPTVSEDTVTKFGNYEFNLVDENEYELMDLPILKEYERKEGGSHQEVKVQSTVNVSDFIVDLDITFNPEFLVFEDIFLGDNTMKFINELKVLEPIQKTRSLWIRVKNMKYFIIANMVSSVYKLNTKTIENLTRLRPPIEVILSVIKCFDVLQQGSLKSPKGTTILIDSDFEEEHFK